MEGEEGGREKESGGEGGGERRKEGEVDFVIHHHYAWS